jgi:hypothetical protein
MDLQVIKSCLEKANVLFEKGLSDSEISRIESKYAFSFPPDLKGFLQFSLPISKGWVDWRKETEPEINSRLNWAYEGICFDIEHNNFWIQEWGEKPDNLIDAFATTKSRIQQAPKLVPIFSHRFIPEKPNEEGNPIFSVVQTDIIIYGNTLETYFQHEFSHYFNQGEIILESEPIHIEFWSYFTDDIYDIS